MQKGFTKNELLITIAWFIVAVGLASWGIWYEYARIDDTEKYSEALQWHSALAWYFHVHAVYPTVPQDGASFVGLCLVDKGLVSITDSACNTPSRIYYASPSSAVSYYPRNADNTVCTDSQGCSRYYLTVSQKTRAISGQPREIFRQAPRGLHIFGPDGLLINQKQIPGI